MSLTPRDGAPATILPSSGPLSIEWAAERLNGGGVIALPTDTVYGIAASLSHPDAIRRLYEIKGREAAKPLPLLVSSSAMLEHVSERVDPDLELLLDRFWPGPLTMVIRARPAMPVEVTAGTGTVGVRMPNHPLALEVITKAGGVIVCTSANISGEAPALDAHEAFEAIGNQVDLILDGGRAPGGVASTVAEVRGGALIIHRDGAIPHEILSAAWNELRRGS